MVNELNGARHAANIGLRERSNQEGAVARKNRIFQLKPCQVFFSIFELNSYVDFSVSPLNVFDNKVSKKIRINYANMGNEVLSDLVFSIYAIDAIHEGLPDGDRSFLGSFKTNITLKPEEITTLEFNLDEFEFPARHVTFEVN